MGRAGRSCLRQGTHLLPKQIHTRARARIHSSNKRTAFTLMIQQGNLKQLQALIEARPERVNQQVYVVSPCTANTGNAPGPTLRVYNTQLLITISISLQLREGGLCSSMPLPPDTPTCARGCCDNKASMLTKQTR